MKPCIPPGRIYNLPMRCLGLDLGSKRIGVAVSDELEVTVRDLTVILRKGGQHDLERIAHLAKELGVEKIVLGLPLNMDGTEGRQAELARKFGETLEEHLHIPVVLWDERLSSWEAEEILAKRGIKPHKRREVVDQVAASIILEDYLRENGEKPK